MVRVLLCTLCILSGSSLLAAEGPQPGTSLEAGPWANADVVLMGIVHEVTELRAPQVARVKVEKVYKGTVAGKVISVVVRGERPTLEPTKPSVPYFRPGVEERFILFLERSPGAVTYGMRTLFDTSDKTGPQKIAAVEAVAEIAAVKGPDAKRRRATRLLSDMLRDPRGWTKTFAARELAWLARSQPEAFDEKTQARIRRVGKSRLTADQRFWLRTLFRALEKAGAKADSPPEDPEDADPWRRTWEAAGTKEDRQRLLARLFADREAFERHGWWAYRQSEPSLRAWYWPALAGTRLKIESAMLRALYPTEEDAGVREQLVRTLGIKGGEADVRWLEERSANLALRRPALLALARIRTASARAALERRRDVFRGAGEADLADWIDYLLSPAFEAAERRAGRAIGGR